ncbi:MAG: DUF4397 domain-containing protein [Gemmatimonadaceae bacterium]|nr:DUF4397 domain-containing protein [Gemmatimonadaceae bacterium]
MLVLSAAALAACGDDDSTAPVALSANVKIIHAIAGANGVDIGVDAARPLTGVNFTNIAPATAGTYLALPAAVPLRLRVFLGATTVIDSTTNLAANQNYTVFASGSPTGTGATAPRFILLQDNVAAPAAGSIRLRAVHAAAGVGNVDIHAAAVGGTFSAATRVFAAVPFRGSGTVEVPAGNYQLCVVGAGTTPTANGSNCAILATTGAVAAGTVATAFARDANAPSETAPQLQITVDRNP